MKNKSPREKRHTRTKEAILEAALQIVAESGTEALSMREIANKIDYSPSGLYEYFASKEEIIKELVNEGFTRLTARLTQVPTRETAASRLLLAGKTYLTFALQEPQLYLLMFNYVPQQAVCLPELIANPAYAILFTILKDGLQEGEFRTLTKTSPEELSYASWAFMHGLAMLHLTIMWNSLEDINLLHERALQVFVEQLR